MPTSFGSIGKNTDVFVGVAQDGIASALPRSTTGTTYPLKRSTEHLPENFSFGSTAYVFVLNANRWVRVYDRVTGKLLWGGKSDGGGLFTVRGLGVKSDAYFAVLEQDAAAGDPGSYNAAILDHLAQS